MHLSIYSCVELHNVVQVIVHSCQKHLQLVSICAVGCSRCCCASGTLQRQKCNASFGNAAIHQKSSVADWQSTALHGTDALCGNGGQSQKQCVYYIMNPKNQIKTNEVVQLAIYVICHVEIAKSACVKYERADVAGVKSQRSVIQRGDNQYEPASCAPVKNSRESGQLPAVA